MARCVLHRNTYLIYIIILITQVIFWRYFGGTNRKLLFPWIKWLWYWNWILNFPWRLFIEMLIFLSFIELIDLIFVCYILDCILKTYRSCYLNVLIFHHLRILWMESVWYSWNKTWKVIHKRYIQGWNGWQSMGKWIARGQQ